MVLKKKRMMGKKNQIQYDHRNLEFNRIEVALLVSFCVQLWLLYWIVFNWLPVTTKSTIPYLSDHDSYNIRFDSLWSYEPTSQKFVDLCICGWSKVTSNYAISYFLADIWLFLKFDHFWQPFWPPSWIWCTVANSECQKWIPNGQEHISNNFIYNFIIFFGLQYDFSQIWPFLAAILAAILDISLASDFFHC